MNRPTESASTESRPLQHKLAAILYADVAGYSRLTGEDEDGTHRILSDYLDAFAAAVQAHNGAVKHYAGDAVLADFSTVSDALTCAVAIQGEFKQRNEALPEAKRVQFRIGVNLGEVIVDRGEVYGNGVNVAARLETLAEPGGICVSGNVVDAIGTKLALHYEYLGEHTVKNIDKPVRAYRVVLDGEATRSTAQSSAVTRRRRLMAGAVVAVVVLATGGVAAWRVLLETPQAPVPDSVLAMPAGPAIAVLPFTNMSGDSSQDYFSDGLTEDIITELTRFRDLYVLARNTTFQYKNQAVDIPTVGKKLGARYVVEGSVRRSGDQVRITAQLIDVASGAHIWAEKYDRNLSDIFIVQDEIASKIVAAITGSDWSALRLAIRESIGKKSPKELQAYEHVLQAGAFTAAWSKENYRLAKTHLEKAIELAPNYARARYVYAYTMLFGWIGHFEDAPALPAEIIRNAIKSVQLDPSDPRAHRTAAAGYFFNKQSDMFEQHATIAVELAPNDFEVLSELGALWTFSGQWERGIGLVTKATALNPSAAAGWYYSAKHYDFFRKGEFQQALNMVRSHPQQDILHTQWKYVAAYAELGQLDKAREHFKKCIELDPTWSAARMRQELQLWNFPAPFIERYLQSYAKAGYAE